MHSLAHSSIRPRPFSCGPARSTQSARMQHTPVLCAANKQACHCQAGRSVRPLHALGSQLQQAVSSAADAARRAGPLVLAGSHMLSMALALQLAVAQPSGAVLNSPNAQIPRSVDAALRRSIPSVNPDVLEVRKAMEEVAFLLRIPQRKPWGNMANNVGNTLQKWEDRGKLLYGVPADKLPAAQQQLDATYAKLKQLELAVKTQQPDFAGVRVAEVLKGVAELQLLQAPGLTFQVPKEYSNLPRLMGRAVVELTIERADSSLAFVDEKNGGLKDQGQVEIVLDGYSAPISAGNFAANVQQGLYNNRPVQASYASVIINAGDTPNISIKPPIPLEILPAGEFDPVYRLPLDVRGGELPVLPLSIPGAVSMTHLTDNDSYLSGDEWFMFKFDKQQAGLSGLAFDEGTFGVFGYCTKGYDIMSHLETGDVIVKAQLLSGADKLVLPDKDSAEAELPAAKSAPPLL